MAIYASTFISGLQQLISEELVKLIPDTRIIGLYDGLLVYSTDIEVEKVKAIGFFNNTFLVLKKFDNLQNDDLDHMVKTGLKIRNIAPKSARNLINRGKKFRIVASKENRLMAVNKDLLRSMEQKIAHHYGLAVDRTKPDVEFWFLYRSEKVGFFMLRMTKHTAYEKILHKGELRPQLSHVLCLLSEPTEDDIVLDPFCGYGSIPIARATMSPYKLIYALDSDRGLVDRLRHKVNNLPYKKSMYIEHADALKLESIIEDGFVDRIITDPPWGFYEDIGMDITDFYRRMLKEFYRVLSPNGICSLLIARGIEFESSLASYKDCFQLCNKYNILVSGKKASIYNIIKKM